MTIGVGVIGAGIMGGDHARTLAQAVKGAALVAITDVNPKRASAVAAATGATRVHADATALIGDPAVEAVLVASPDPTHEEQVLACLAAGKPVLCEKPLAPTIEGCRRIVAAEMAFGRRMIQVGFMRRFDPGYRAMREALASGTMGAPLLMHCVHRNAEAPPSFTSDMLVTNSAVHEIDIARWLLDRDFATATVFRRAAAAEGALVDPQFIVLETNDGILVDIEVFVNARYGYDVRAELVCETGSLTLAPQAPVHARRGGCEAAPLAADWRAHFSDAYRNQLQAWIASLESGAPTGASAWDGYAATAIAAACLEALHSGATARIDIPTRPDFYQDDPAGTATIRRARPGRP